MDKYKGDIRINANSLRVLGGTITIYVIAVVATMGSAQLFETNKRFDSNRESGSIVLGTH